MLDALARAVGPNLIAARICEAARASKSPIIVTAVLEYVGGTLIPRYGIGRLYPPPLVAFLVSETCLGSTHAPAKEKATEALCALHKQVRGGWERGAVQGGAGCKKRFPLALKYASLFLHLPPPPPATTAFCTGRAAAADPRQPQVACYGTPPRSHPRSPQGTVRALPGTRNVPVLLLFSARAAFPRPHSSPFRTHLRARAVPTTSRRPRPCSHRRRLSLGRWRHPS
jgi:hypothetical protein